VLHGCKTLFLILREEHRLKVFKKRVLTKISGPKREKVTGGWRKLNIEECHDLYSLPNVTKVMKLSRM
jgi:hypothetical protein